MTGKLLREAVGEDGGLEVHRFSPAFRVCLLFVPHPPPPSMDFHVPSLFSDHLKYILLLCMHLQPSLVQKTNHTNIPRQSTHSLTHLLTPPRQKKAAAVSEPTWRLECRPRYAEQRQTRAQNGDDGESSEKPSSLPGQAEEGERKEAAPETGRRSGKCSESRALEGRP